MKTQHTFYPLALDGFTIVHFPKSIDEDIILGRPSSSALKFPNLLFPSRFLKRK